MPVLAGLGPAVLGCQGRRKGDLPSDLEFSITWNYINTSLHNCVESRSQNLKENKTPQFLEESLASESG